MWLWTSALICACYLSLERGATALGSGDGTWEDLEFSQTSANPLATEELSLGLTTAVVDGDDVFPDTRNSPASSSIPSGRTAVAEAASAERRKLRDGGGEREDSSAVDEGESEGVPEVLVSLEAQDKPQPPQREEEAEGDGGPGARIEEMGEHWTQHASVPSLAGAVLKNVRSVYSEISNDILVRLRDHSAETRHTLLLLLCCETRLHPTMHPFDCSRALRLRLPTLAASL